MFSLRRYFSDCHRHWCYPVWHVVLAVSISVFPVQWCFASTFQEKSDSIFDAIEGSYGQYFPSWNIANSEWYQSCYFRIYEIGTGLATCTGNEGVYYNVDGNWTYYGTLDEANQYLCNNQCFASYGSYSYCPQEMQGACEACFSGSTAAYIVYANGYDCTNCGMSASSAASCTEYGRQAYEMLQDTIDSASNW